jgi:hypothetical protein
MARLCVGVVIHARWTDTSGSGFLLVVMNAAEPMLPSGLR